MKKLLFAAAILLVPGAASADHADVIGFKLTESCSFSKYMAIVGDFNKWGAKNGYQAKVFMPLQSNDLSIYYWVGTTKNAAAFGAAWDAWRDALGNPSTDAAKLQARFTECSVNVSRDSYDVY